MNRIELRLGQAIGLKELVATLVVSGILLIVGTVIFSQVRDTMPTTINCDTGYTYNATSDNCMLDTNTSETTTKNTAGLTIDDVESTAYDAFQLATVSLIVLAAAVIIGILIRAFGA